MTKPEPKDEEPRWYLLPSGERSRKGRWDRIDDDLVRRILRTKEETRG
jgi:hypothetical protein